MLRIHFGPGAGRTPGTESLKPGSFIVSLRLTVNPSITKRFIESLGIRERFLTRVLFEKAEPNPVRLTVIPGANPERPMRIESFKSPETRFSFPSHFAQHCGCLPISRRGADGKLFLEGAVRELGFSVSFWAVEIDFAADQTKTVR
jgi:hypothetical protein